MLVRYTYTPESHFPSNVVEVGQAVEAALTDELLQETGLCLLRAAHGIFFNSCVIARYHVVVYLCDATGKLPIKSPILEIS